ncbi:MAG TPA: hypothetical protein VFS20_02740 [Longimicrobium sp.]|nr:hypothetical protein [Longimicrobium sp.]
MYYDDTTRRLNLLSGLVFGAALGAGLALLFLPEERLQSGGRIVVRAARTLGRDLGEATGRERTPSPARKRAERLARRKFEL